MKDLAASQSFYERVLGFVEIFREDGRLHAMNVSSRHVLLLFAQGQSVNATDTPGGRIPAHDGHGQLHLAFEIVNTEIDVWRQRLSDLGVVIESEVECPRGGHSIYFRDPDLHLIELVTRNCWDLS